MLKDRGYGADNPGAVIRKGIKIDIDRQTDRPALDATQVQKLAPTANGLEEEPC